MKKFGVLSLALATVLLAGSAFAQKKGDNSYYFTTYFSNANTPGAPDATLYLVNDGDSSTSQSEGQPNGLMGAVILVFDDSQELQECCGCLISADGLLTESVNYELTANTLTGRPVTRGVIKVIGYSFPAGIVIAPGLRGSMTHIQAGQNGNYYTTEAPLADSNLSSPELNALEQLCDFTFTLGSGQGLCSCSEEVDD
jgi:hypothetical protein